MVKSRCLATNQGLQSSLTNKRETTTRALPTTPTSTPRTVKARRPTSNIKRASSLRKECTHKCQKWRFHNPNSSWNRLPRPTTPTEHPSSMHNPAAANPPAGEQGSQGRIGNRARLLDQHQETAPVLFQEKSLPSSNSYIPNSTHNHPRLSNKMSQSTTSTSKD